MTDLSTSGHASNRIPGRILISAGLGGNMPTTERPLRSGRLLAEISTKIVGIVREHYGRGPMKAKTYALDDIIVCVMRGSGFTAFERTIMDSGDPERVVEMRHEFQRVMTRCYCDAIEDLTDRRVEAFLSQAHIDPDVTIDVFVLDRPLEGFGTVDLVAPGQTAAAATSAGRPR